MCSVAALRGWRLRSADISMAFLRGLTFETISKRTGQPIRSLQFDLPPGAASILRMIPGYENFDPATEKKLAAHPDLPRFARKRACRKADSEAEKATGDLVVIAFYYLL